LEIKLYNDIVFKWIFGRQDHTGPLMAFLNAVVGHDKNEEGVDSSPKFTKVQILNPYDQSEPFTNEKQGILDLRLQDKNSQEWIDIEIQVIYSADYAQRSKFYLAGMYRDQLKKSKNRNYDELKPCYGIHLLVDNFFRDKKDNANWFHHYAILNTRTYQPLLGHWHLYYAELNKFKSCLEEQHGSTTNLEQWVHFIGHTQDSSSPLNPFVASNKEIKEVLGMLHTFTQNDKLREQYRLHEEFLRVQRGEEARRQKLKKALAKERIAKERERAAKEKERAAKDVALKAETMERIAKEAALKAEKEALKKKEDLEKRSVLIMKKAGHSDKEIAQLLDIPLEKVK